MITEEDFMRACDRVEAAEKDAKRLACFAIDKRKFKPEKYIELSADEELVRWFARVFKPAIEVDPKIIFTSEGMKIKSRIGIAIYDEADQDIIEENTKDRAYDPAWGRIDIYDFNRLVKAYLGRITERYITEVEASVTEIATKALTKKTPETICSSLRAETAVLNEKYSTGYLRELRLAFFANPNDPYSLTKNLLTCMGPVFARFYDRKADFGRKVKSKEVFQFLKNKEEFDDCMKACDSIRTLLDPNHTSENLLSKSYERIKQQTLSIPTDEGGNIIDEQEEAGQGPAES